MALPDTTHRLLEPSEPAESVSERIWQETTERVRRYAERPGSIDDRLRDLDREWDIERILAIETAAFSLAGIVLGILASFWWLLLPGLLAAFLLEHAVHGWCPPVAVFRQMGIRTRMEIEAERYALKGLRGDFRGLQGPAPSRAARAERALQAIRA